MISAGRSIQYLVVMFDCLQCGITTRRVSILNEGNNEMHLVVRHPSHEISHHEIFTLLKEICTSNTVCTVHGQEERGALASITKK